MKKEIELNDIHGTKHVFCVGDSFNKGKFGTDKMIKRSINELGCGRSILVDADNNVLAGEKTLEAAYEQGKRVILIETTGDELVVVKRTDVKQNSKKGLELSLVDNLIASKTLDWNTNLVRQRMNETLSFEPRCWNGYECLVEELNIEDFLKEEVVRQSPIQKTERVINNEKANLSLFE